MITIFLTVIIGTLFLQKLNSYKKTQNIGLYVTISALIGCYLYFFIGYMVMIVNTNSSYEKTFQWHLTGNLGPKEDGTDTSFTIKSIDYLLYNDNQDTLIFEDVNIDNPDLNMDEYYGMRVLRSYFEEINKVDTMLIGKSEGSTFEYEYNKITTYTSEGQISLYPNMHCIITIYQKGLNYKYIMNKNHLPLIYYKFKHNSIFTSDTKIKIVTDLYINK